MNRYFGAFNKSRQDRWVFGDRDSGAYLLKFAWTKIVRHQLVMGGSSPDDPALDLYWARRRRKGLSAMLDKATRRLLMAQNGRCPACAGFLLHADSQPRSPLEWEQWLAAVRKAVSKSFIVLNEHGTADGIERRLLHAYCESRRIADDSKAQHR